MITVAGKVPRNDALDRLDPDRDEGRSYWRTYLADWARPNTACTITSPGGVLAYAIALSGI